MYYYCLLYTFIRLYPEWTFHSFYSIVERSTLFESFLQASMMQLLLVLSSLTVSIIVQPCSSLCESYQLPSKALKDLNDAFPRVSKWFVYGIQGAIFFPSHVKTKKVLLACQLSAEMASPPFRPRADSPATLPPRTYVNP
jgi:hypothetical protein